MHLVRRRELHKPVLIYAYLAERILVSLGRERALLQLSPVNALFHLWAIVGLLRSCRLARLLLVYFRISLGRVLVAVYTI
jgi:hypothetical protein